MDHQAYGTLTSDTTTTEVDVTGWVTLCCHIDSGSGTLTWQFKGPDGVWRTIYGGSDGTTAQSFTAAHSITAYFGGDVTVRGSLASSSTPVFDWQIIGSTKNR